MAQTSKLAAQRRGHGDHLAPQQLDLVVTQAAATVKGGDVVVGSDDGVGEELQVGDDDPDDPGRLRRCCGCRSAMTWWQDERRW